MSCCLMPERIPESTQGVGLADKVGPGPGQLMLPLMLFLACYP